MSEDKKSNLKSFPGGGTANEMAEAIRNMRASFEYVMESQGMIAKLLKHKYDALCENGFTPEQALELCKQGMNW